MKALYDFAVYMAKDQCVLYQDAHETAYNNVHRASARSTEWPEDAGLNEEEAIVWQKAQADHHRRMAEAREHWSRLVAERDRECNPLTRFIRECL